MKFFAVLALCVAVASANIMIPVVPGVVTPDQAQVQDIISAINHPSTDPATAAALEQMLYELIFGKPEVGPAVVDNYEPISVGPAIVDSYEPIVVGPGLVPADVAAPVQTLSAPLVQIILNVNQAQAEVINPSPVIVEEAAQEPIVADPVIIVEPQPEPVVIGTPILPTPVIVPEPAAVGNPILPVPVITLPEILN